MAGDQWSDLSARYEERWDETLVAEPAAINTQRDADAGPLVLRVGAQVEAVRHGRQLDFSVTYDHLPHLRYTRAEFIGDRWRATRRDGTHLEGIRGSEHDFQEAGISFLLDPQGILDHSEVLSEEAYPDGTRRLRLREPQVATVVTRSGHHVDFGRPQPRWRHIADDVSFHGADAYVAVVDPASGLVLRWDALKGARILRRLELVDVTLRQVHA
jgi:hypothetical protein